MLMTSPTVASNPEKETENTLKTLNISKIEVARFIVPRIVLYFQIKLKGFFCEHGKLIKLEKCN